MKSKTYTYVKTTDAYGKPIEVYRDIKARLEVIKHGDDSSWFIKLKHLYGLGADRAVNISHESAIALSDILKDIRAKEKSF